MSIRPKEGEPGVFIDTETGKEIRIIDFIECRCGPDFSIGKVRPGCPAHAPDLVKCSDCGGSGYYPIHFPPPPSDDVLQWNGSPPCPTCNGRGYTKS